MTRLFRSILFLVLLLACSRHASAAACSNTAVGTFTCVQSKAIANASSATPTLVMGSNLTSGSILLGGFSWQSNSITLNSITASSGCTGATFTIVDNPTSSVERSAGWYATGYSSGACTVQFNLSGAAVSAAGAHEVTGGATVTPIGTRHAAAAFDNQPTATDVATGAVTASGTDYIFGFWGELSNGNSAAAGAGYTLREANANISGGWGTEDKAASGSNAVHWTTTAGGNYGGVVLLDLAPLATTSCAHGMLGVFSCDEAPQIARTVAPVVTCTTTAGGARCDGPF